MQNEMTPAYNTDETVTVIMNLTAQTSGTGVADMLRDQALRLLSGDDAKASDIFDDVYSFEIITRPSGSRYVRVSEI